MCVCKVGRVYAGGVVGREGVGDEKAEGGLYYEYLGVGTEENVCIGAVRLHRLL
jgi:hypothetical protein